MSLFFKLEQKNQLNGIKQLSKNRVVFLDVKPRTPDFERYDGEIRHINLAEYPPLKKKDAVDDLKMNKVSFRIKQRKSTNYLYF